MVEPTAVALALRERVKELTGLHRASELLHDLDWERAAALQAVAELLPPAMQFPEHATACVRYEAEVFATPGHVATASALQARFETSNGARGEVEVAYRDGARTFLAEETTLLSSVAAMVRHALERDLVLAELRERNDQLNLALETAGMAVWEWDLASNIVRWSEQLVAMTGVGGARAMPMAARADVVHPEDRDGLMMLLLGVAERGDATPRSIEFRLRRPDGGWRPVLAAVRAVPGAQRRVIAALVDVTLRHALEAGLRQVQKVESLGQVAAGVAHDFNNLLSVIIGSVEYLQRLCADDHPWRDIIDDIHTAARNGVGLTRQLLDFSRDGKVEPAPVALGVLVGKLESVLVRLAGRGIRLRTELDPGVGMVWADPTQLEQVLMNLVVNARDAMQDTGAITVRTAAEDGHAVLAVTDTGPGVPAELHARIFEPFFTTKAPGKGTGLGLALVASVARQWHGRVELVSPPGAGATFRLLLPCVARDA